MTLLSAGSGHPTWSNVRCSLEWDHRSFDDVDCHLAGNVHYLSGIVRAATSKNLDDLSRLLLRERGTFGLIIVTPTMIIAVTDRIRSYPVYLRRNDRGMELATETSDWVNPEARTEFDEDGTRLFLAAGHTIGAETLFHSVRRLLPGEILIIDRASKDVSFRRYYFFQPRFQAEMKEPSNKHSPQDLENRLEFALDNATKRVIERANGARIWVPLSAGYDSRAVLAKLLSNGYDRVETFSYGSSGNMEARVAKELAEKAGVPWRFVPSLPNRPREVFLSQEVTRYFLFAGGLGSTPTMSEFLALKQLKQSEVLDQEDYIVNGQTGDFLTGNHIPSIETFSELCSFCLNKHFANSASEQKAIGNVGINCLLENWIARYLPDQSSLSFKTEQMLSLYQTFEWQERQSQYVVQQQRAYDFLGIHWALPLWDADLMELYEEVPLHEQRGQALYLRYLSKWNYRGLFTEGKRPYDPWPRHGLLFKSVGRLTSLLFGPQSKKEVYKSLYYWTDLHSQYGLFGYRTFFTLRHEMRNPVFLFALRYLQLLRKHLRLPPPNEQECNFARLIGG